MGFILPVVSEGKTTNARLVWLAKWSTCVPGSPNIANEFKRPKNREWDDGIDEGNEVRVRETVGGAHHALLRYTDVEEPVWKTVGKWLERNETKIRGQENDSLIDFRQL